MRKTEAQFDIEQIVNTYEEYDFEVISQSESHVSFINSNGFTPYIETIYIDDKDLPNLTEELGAIEKKNKFPKYRKNKIRFIFVSIQESTINKKNISRIF